MQLKMGYVKGSGLGKDAQGIAEPITESSQLGRHGLGFHQGLQRETVLDQEIEDVTIVLQPLDTFPSHGGRPIPTAAEMEGWMVEAPCVWPPVSRHHPVPAIFRSARLPLMPTRVR